MPGEVCSVPVNTTFHFSVLKEQVTLRSHSLKCEAWRILKRPDTLLFLLYVDTLTSRKMFAVTSSEGKRKRANRKDECCCVWWLHSIQSHVNLVKICMSIYSSLFNVWDRSGLLLTPKLVLKNSEKMLKPWKIQVFGRVVYNSATGKSRAADQFTK